MFKAFKGFFKATVGMKDCGEMPKTATMADVTSGTATNPADVSPSQGITTKNQAPVPPVAQ